MNVSVARVVVTVLIGAVATWALAVYAPTNQVLLSSFWLAEGVVGSIFGFVILRQAQEDLKAAATNGVTKLYTQAVVRREILRLATQSVIVVVGIVSFFKSPWVGRVTLAGLLFLPYVIGINSGFDATLRRRMQEYMRRQDAGLAEGSE